MNILIWCIWQQGSDIVGHENAVEVTKLSERKTMRKHGGAYGDYTYVSYYVRSYTYVRYWSDHD